jgi:hypothetical protein
LSGLTVVDDDSTLIGANGGTALSTYLLDTKWVADGDAEGNPMPKALVTLFGENLKKDFIGEKVGDGDDDNGGSSNSGNTTGNTTGNTDTEPADTTAPTETTAAPATTEAPAVEEKGCGGTIGLAGVALVTTVGLAGAVVARKKKD